VAYTRVYTITTTRQLVIPVDGSTQEVHVHNESGTMYIGGADVTSSNGFKLDNNDKTVLTVHPGDQIYAVTNTGTAVLMILVLLR
jgi:hypothetical protein